MISKGYKKQLIINAYKTQLLPDNDEINKTSFNINKNWLLFKINDKSLRVEYKYKDINISWVLIDLITPIFSIYYYSEENFNIQKNISDNMEYIAEQIQDIEKHKNYVEYLENIYD